MALVMGYDDAKSNLLKRTRPTTKGDKLGYFNFRDQPDMPHASLNQHDPGGHWSSAHFHRQDQFQVVVDGKFKIGRHELTPYCVHFTRAYTPYGPLVSEGDPFSFMVMRAHRDSGSQHLPKELPQLQSVQNRRPFQISRHVKFPDVRDPARDVILTAVPDMMNEEGLAVYTMIVKPNVKTKAPDPAHGDGQYLLVVKGSLIHEGTERKALGLVFVKSEEGAHQLQAGPQGLEAIVLNFPQVDRRAASEKVQAPAPGYKKWQCLLCAFAYDEALGMPDEGIPPGTRWEDVPATWICPDCSASKGDFEMVEVV
jgi:rubredoxin